MSSYTRMKKIFLRGLLWLYLFGFGYMALTLEPGFLDFDNLPDTNFTCIGKVIGGYYADLETNCQMFHVCTIGQLDEPMDIRFLCLNGTVFDQETRVCERVDEVDCSKSERFYSLNLELYGNSQLTNVEENSETEQPLIIKSTLPTTTTTTSTEPTKKPSRPSYYTSSSSNPVKSSTTQVLTHHFPGVNPNSADIRFNPEEINISLNPGAPPDIRTNPSYHPSSVRYSDRPTGYSDKSAGYRDGYSDKKVVVTTHRGVFDSNSDKRKEVENTSQLQKPSVQKTVANVQGYDNRPTSGDINYDFSYTDSSELEGYQTESYAFQKEFRPSKQYLGPLHNTQYQATTFHSITTPKVNNFQQQKSSTTARNFYLQSLKPPAPNQQNHYVQHQTEKAPHRIQLPLPFLPTLPPLAFSSPAPFALQHHIDAKRYTKEHLSPPRIIISASASVSDASGRRLNYSLGTIGAAQILEEPPGSYDEYKETDVALDPFYHDVPKLKHSKRRKRSLNVPPALYKRNQSHRIKRETQGVLKHSDIIKNEQDAVNVLKFLFDWYRNEKTNPARATTPVSKPLVSEEILKINDEFSSSKPEESSIEVSTGLSEKDPIDVRYKNNDLFNKKSKYSILGDDKYSVTEEEVKKVSKVQQNLSFADSKDSPKYSLFDDYVDDNYEPETYKYDFGGNDDHHDRFKYTSFLEDTITSDKKDFFDDKDDYVNFSKYFNNEETKNSSIPKDYVDDNIEPLYYKERYDDSEEKTKVVQQRNSSEEKYSDLALPEHENITSENDNHEESIQTSTEKELETTNEPSTQVEENRALSQAHLQSIDIEEKVVTTTEQNNIVGEELIATEQPKLITSTTKIYHDELHTSKPNHHPELNYEQNETDSELNVNEAPDYHQYPLSTPESTTFNSPETTVINNSETSLNYQTEETPPETFSSKQYSEIEIQSSSTKPEETNVNDGMSLISPTTDFTRLHISNENILHQTSESAAINSVSPVSEMTVQITELIKVNQSEPEVNVVVSKATRTNKSRIRANGRGRHKFKDPEVNFKNVFIEKLIEKPYRAKDDYDYLKTVSNVQSSTTKLEDENESNNTDTIPIHSRVLNETQVSPNNLLLDESSTAATTTSKRRRGRQRYRVESTTIAPRNVRKRRPTPAQLSSDSQIYSQNIETSLKSSTNFSDVTQHSIEDTSNKESTDKTAGNVHQNESKEPFSEILEQTTATSQEPIERKIDEIEIPIQLFQNEPSTELPVVDTIQTTPTTVMVQNENLGTTNYPPTEPTLKTDKTISLDQFNEMDKIVEMYATSFVGTERTHVTKKKELKERENDELLTTTIADIETTETTHEPTTIWKYEVVNDDLVSNSHNVQESTTNLPTQEEPVQTTLKTYYSSSILESTLKSYYPSGFITKPDIETTETASEPTTIWNHEVVDDSFVSHSHNIRRTTTNLPSQEELDETTLKTYYPSITLDPTLKTYYPSTILQSVTEEILTNIKTTDNPVKESTKKYSINEETQGPKSSIVTESLQKLIEEIESTTNSIVAPMEKQTSPRYRIRTRPTKYEIENKQLKERMSGRTTSNDALIKTNEITGSERHHIKTEKTSTETINVSRETTPPKHYYESTTEVDPETTTTLDDDTNTQTPTTLEVTTAEHELSYTTILPSQPSEAITTQRTRLPRVRGRPSRKRPSNVQTERSNYRHRFSTDEFTRRPESRNQTIEEEIINSIYRRSKKLTTQPTIGRRKLIKIPTDVPLRKSASPTQREISVESPLTTPLSRKTTVRKYYFFNCFNKETNKFYPDQRDCRLFHYCTEGYTKNQLLDMKFVCDYNTYFDDENLVCTKKKPKRCL